MDWRSWRTSDRFRQSRKQSQLEAETGLRLEHFFMLQGFFSHERELMRSLKSYHQNPSAGFSYFHYRKDQRDYRRQTDSLDVLRSTFPRPYLPPKLCQFTKLLENEGAS